MKSLELEKSKNSKVYKIIAIILYVIAGAFFVVGLVFALRALSNIMPNLSLNLPTDVMSSSSQGVEYSISDFGFTYFMIALGLAFVATMFLCLSKRQVLSKSKKSYNVSDFDKPVDVMKYAEKPQPQPYNEETKEEIKKIYCAYCGTELDPTDKKCPNCGSSKKVQK